MTAHSLVYSSIGSTTDKPNDLVAVNDSHFALISHVGTNTPITWIWTDISKIPSRQLEQTDGTKEDVSEETCYFPWET